MIIDQNVPDDFVASNMNLDTPEEGEEVRSNYIHKVHRQHLDEVKAGTREIITAVCGFTWKPSFPMDFEKPKCEICFPERISDRCYAA